MATELKLWKAQATYTDGVNTQDFITFLYADSAVDAFRYLCERTEQIGLMCIGRSVQRLEESGVYLK